MSFTNDWLDQNLTPHKRVETEFSIVHAQTKFARGFGLIVIVELNLKFFVTLVNMDLIEQMILCSMGISSRKMGLLI